MSGDFIGRGWTFPIHTNATGGIALVGREQKLVESIRLILGTAPGERPMRPEFGCGIHDLVFESADATTAGRVAYRVRVALERWEPRIEVNDVSVSYGTPGLMYVDISYTERETNSQRNLVFPFYVIPEERDNFAPGDEILEPLPPASTLAAGTPAADALPAASTPPALGPGPGAGSGSGPDPERGRP